MTCTICGVDKVQAEAAPCLSGLGRHFYSQAIVALDIDGVLVPFRSEFLKARPARPDPKCVEALNFFLVETKAKIVLSSTWRRFSKFEKLQEMFVDWGINGELVDKTPFIPGERGPEIEEWWSSNPGPLVILDDDQDMGRLKPFLVKTESEVGLTMDDAKMAIALVKGQILGAIFRNEVGLP